MCSELDDTQLEALRQQVEAMSKSVTSLTKERDEYRKMYMEMLELVKRLEQGILPRKSERQSPGDQQLSLQILSTLLADEAPTATPESPAPEAPVAPAGTPAPAPPAPPAPPADKQRPKPTGRKPFPANIPRIHFRLLPPEVEREGLDNFVQIGEETSEVLERRRSSLVVLCTCRPKFIRKSELPVDEPIAPAAVDDEDDEPKVEVLIAEPIELPIPRGMAGPGLLSDTIVQRWQDHLPLNRQESIFARDGVELARSTICRWHIQLAQLVSVLVEAMAADALAQPVLLTDATGVLVRDTEKCRRGHFWVLIAPGRHVLFRFSASHDSAAVDRLLPGYTGYLVADAHIVYEHLYKKFKIIEVGCWAHARRYFHKALTTDPVRSREAIALIGGLFGPGANLGCLVRGVMI